MPSYASLAELKASLRINDTDDDSLLQVALDSATELIDDHCNRTFVADAAATTRYFEPGDNGFVEIDDIYTTSGLVVTVGGTVIPSAVYGVSAGYVLYPMNALAEGEPYTAMDYLSFPWTAFPLLAAIRRAQVAITAKWGYSLVVPTVVKEACILQASRLWSRRLAPFGVAGSPEIGSEIRLLNKVDPDVAVLLSGKVRYR